MANLILAGVLLALAYERYERLWFPIGIHIAWNVASGPILGYDVSGYVPSQTVLRTIGTANVVDRGDVRDRRERRRPYVRNCCRRSACGGECKMENAEGRMRKAEGSFI